MALKLLNRSLDNPEDRERFLREGRLAASVSHPNSVYVYETREIEGIPAIAMELVDGGTLRDRVARDGPARPAEAVDAMLQLIAGLEAAAQRGVLHRDIKPANCFIDRTGIVKIGDYGLSLPTSSADITRLTAQGVFMGTPAYASPEQVRCSDIDVRSDIYSAGATLYFLLTGRAPFVRASAMQVFAAVLQENPDPPDRLISHVPRGIAEVVKQCLRKDPRDRFASYAELRDALLPFGTRPAEPARWSARVRAGLIDLLLSTAIFVLLRLSPVPWIFRLSLEGLALVAYFGVLEGRTGQSLGKKAVGLRVVRLDGAPAGFWRAAVRALVFVALIAVPAVFDLVFPDSSVVSLLFTAFERPLMSFLAMAGLFAAAWTRSRRGLHEVLSGTRTIGVRPSSRAVATTGPAANLSIALDSRAQQVGRFVLSGRLWDDGGEALDEGVDALNRRVWVHHVPPDRPLPSPARQQLASDVRLRWLDGQRSPSGSWDAYAAVDGQPLSPRDWAAVRAWLISLARELDRGIKDSTLALPLAIDRIWIATDGTVRMSDFPLVPPGGAETQLLDVTAAQRFLRQFAREALSHDAAGILPLAARRVLERLERQSYVTLNDVLVALEAVPSAVGIKSGVRAATVGLASILPGVMLTLAIVEVPKALAVRRSPDLDHLDRIITVYDRERRESGRFNFTADVLNRTRAQPRGLYSVGLGLNRWPAGGLGRFTDAQRRAFLTYLDSHVAAHGFALMRQLGPSYIVSRLLPRYSPSRLTASPAEQDSARQVAAPVLAHIEAVASQRRPFWLDHGLWIQVRVSAAYFVPALFGIVLAALFRGAVMLRLFGYDFVGPDGRRATYRRAVWRSVVAWSPALVWGAVLPPLAASSLSPLTVALIGVAVNLVMIGGAIWGIRHPNNSIQDRVARTKVVPA